MICSVQYPLCFVRLVGTIFFGPRKHYKTCPHTDTDTDNTDCNLTNCTFNIISRCHHTALLVKYRWLGGWLTSVKWEVETKQQKQHVKLCPETPCERFNPQDSHADPSTPPRAFGKNKWMKFSRNEISRDMRTVKQLLCLSAYTNANCIFSVS